MRFTMEETEKINYHDPNTIVYWNPRHQSYTIEPLEEESIQTTYQAAIEAMKERAALQE